MNAENVYLSVLVVAAVTLFTRAFPFLCYRKRRPPEILGFIEDYIPPMIMVLLVLYCLKGIDWTAAPHGLPEVACILLVAGLQWWRENPLVSIFGGTFCYMFLVQSKFWLPS
jgi:branched-subunit amino acid transport protein AzlD